MAFENFPELQTSKENESAENKDRNNIRGILTAILVVALLGTWGYIIWDKNNIKETIQQKDTIIATTSGQRDVLQKELEDATMRYDMLKTSNSRKDSTITAKDREIDMKKARIQSLLSKLNATEAELTEARTLIRELNGDIEGYKNQVELLQGQKIQLAQEKVAVTQQRDKIQKAFDSSVKVIQDKESIIEVGSTLHASNFNIIGLQDKGRGKEKETTTAKKVDKLRITFDLDENLITATGTKELYIVITAPDGKTIAIDEMGSGRFMTREGDSKMYTQKLEVNYEQNKRQTISFDWKQTENFATGLYRIEVYNNGFKIGEGYRPLKKGGLFG
jgi:hypothetical protein